MIVTDKKAKPINDAFLEGRLNKPHARIAAPTNTIIISTGIATKNTPGTVWANTPIRKRATHPEATTTGLPASSIDGRSIVDSGVFI
jgi:hypothetical protein